MTEMSYVLVSILSYDAFVDNLLKQAALVCFYLFFSFFGESEFY